MHIEARGDCIWEIAREGGMHVPGRVLASPALMDELRGDVTLQQVVNVAHLPGIVGYSWAMPDAHLGYGFPIGGVAATVPERGGVISPGGVGYDINCGVRLATLNLTRSELLPRIERLVSRLFETLPCGAHPHQSGTGDLSADEMRRVLRDGAAFAVQRGFGADVDLEHSEEEGAMRGADPAEVSDAAIERGRRQLGSVGSGNHFVEVGCVSRVFEPEVARVLGLAEDSVTVMIHCGSRGLGHQVCTDHVRVVSQRLAGWGIHLPDRQLACAPLGSSEAVSYLGAMRAAANFAWANRQCIADEVRRAFELVLGRSAERLGLSLVYDVAHNIAKFETHEITGGPTRCLVHRKGATRSFPAGHADVPAAYRAIGQPVLVPGDMGRCSYVLVGRPGAMKHAFGSTCHGAGRQMSRTRAVRETRGRDLVAELRQAGVIVRYEGRDTLREETSEAYKDVAHVVRVVAGADLARPVARLKPFIVVKG
jgi:tRNA-splicing ligase RtcB